MSSAIGLGVVGLAVTGTVFGWVCGCENAVARSRQAAAVPVAARSSGMGWRGVCFLLLLLLVALGTIVALTFQPGSWVLGSVLLMAMVVGCAIDGGKS